MAEEVPSPPLSPNDQEIANKLAACASQPPLSGQKRLIDDLTKDEFIQALQIIGESNYKKQKTAEVVQTSEVVSQTSEVEVQMISRSSSLSLFETGDFEQIESNLLDLGSPLSFENETKQVNF